MSISSQLPPIPVSQAGGLLRALEGLQGKVVEARVIGSLANGTTQVQIGQHSLAITLPSPQATGTTLTLSVGQANGQMQLSLLSVALPQPSPNISQLGSAPAATVQLSPAAQGQAAVTNLAQIPSGTTTPPAAANPQSQPAVASVAASSVTTRPAMPVPAQPGSSPIPLVPYATVPSGQAAQPVSSVAQGAVTPVAHAAQLGQQPTPVIAGTAAVSSAAAQQPAISPQAALTQMVQQAIPNQNSVIGLTSMLTAVSGTVPLPEPVAKAMQQVLAQRLSLDGSTFNGRALQTAVGQSGVFQEAKLGAGQGAAATTDLKTALLGLKQSLGAWLGSQAAIEKVATIPPPLRELIPRARGGDAPATDLPDDAEQVGRMLQERTESALSRLRLHQAASLPDQADRPGVQWSLDLPVMVSGQQMLLHMHIHGDPEEDAERPEDRGWQLRFAINFPSAGEVGAQVTLRHKTTGVLLWAENPETAQILQSNIDELKQDLENVDLIPGAVIVKAGAPTSPAIPVGSGSYLDATR